MIVSPPRIVGTKTVAAFLGVSAWWLYRAIPDEPPYVGEWAPGYLGKIANKHTWNFHELIASTFDSEASLELVVSRMTDPAPADPLDTLLCGAAGCDGAAEQLGLCTRHLRRMFTAWRHSSRSSLVTMQLVAMCRWIVDRNAHLVLPADFDPWSNVCMTPGCGGSTNVHGDHAEGAWHGPLCLECSAKFWNYSRTRPRPAHWKKSRTAA